MLPLCQDQGIAVIPWSPLARGRLTRDWDAETERSRTDEFGSSLYDSAASDREIVEQVAAVPALDVTFTAEELESLEAPYTPHPAVGFA